MSSIVGTIVVILLLTFIGGWFSAAEIALIAARKGRLKQAADDGDHASRLALELASSPNRFLATAQLGITLTVVLAGAFGGERIIGDLAEQFAALPLGFLTDYSKFLAFTIVGGSITFVHLLLAELVPKQLALRHSYRLARHVARPMDVLARIGWPVIWLANAATEVVVFALGSRASHDDSAVRIEDIEHMIQTGTTSGVLDPAEQRLALEALRLGESTVRDIMRPRTDMDALDVETPSREVLGAVAMAGFSRLPVYDGDLDHILGFVYIKDVLRRHYLGVPIDLRKILHPAIYVPETLSIDRLLVMFQTQHTQMAIVLDEFGGTEGLVTLEDVVEELVGEIRDEHRRDEDQRLVRRDDGSWLVDGSVPLTELLERLNLSVADEPPRRFRTVAGLVLTELGQIPRVGESVGWNGWRWEVVDMDGTRIDRVLVSQLPPADEAAKADN